MSENYSGQDGGWLTSTKGISISSDKEWLYGLSPLAEAIR